MSDEEIYSWFLGPKAENADALERLVLDALRDCIFWRRNFHPEDESLITEKVKRESEFQDSQALLRQELINLLAHLKRDIPFYSPRYIGHMLGDQLLPALVGYFAAMLHNPNNISTESSSITTVLETEVAAQLAEMIGYAGETWGHIASGGSIANFEALWVARNLKFLPLAAKKVAMELELKGVSIEKAAGDTCALDAAASSVPSQKYIDIVV